MSRWPGTSFQRLAFSQDSSAAAQHRQRIIIEDIQSSGDPRVQIIRDLGLSASPAFRFWRSSAFGRPVRHPQPPASQADDLAVLCPGGVRSKSQLPWSVPASSPSCNAPRRRAGGGGPAQRSFPAMLAHELRNSLAPMVNALRSLRLRQDQDPVQQRARSAMERQVRHIYASGQRPARCVAHQHRQGHAAPKSR